MFAKIINGSIVDTVQGSAPEGYVQADLRFNIPTQYPKYFYTKTSSNPNTYIQNNVPVVEYDYQIKPLDVIKQEISQYIKQVRKVKQLGSFMFGDVEVPLTNREDSLIIATLPEVELNYKVAEGVFVTLTGAQVAELKEAHRLHVQSAYDWEMNKSAELSALTTYETVETFLSAIETDNPDIAFKPSSSR